MGKQKKTEGISSCSSKAITIKSDIIMDNRSIDYFSRLPDSVLAHIFYFLPMKETISMCILSKSLSRLWTSISNFEFTDFVGVRTSEKARKIVEIFNKILEHRYGPIRSCRLALSYGCYISHVGRWVSLLIQNGVEELDLDLQLDDYAHFKLPSCVFSSKSLRVLKLKSCLLRPPPGFTGLGALETLVIGHASLSEDLIRSLLSQCNLLRSLTLQNCFNFGKLEISGCNTLLESLTVENCASHVEVDAPYVKNLCFRGEKTRFSIKGASNAINVDISRNARFHVNDQEGNNLKNNVLANLLDVQSLSLTGWAFKCFAAGHLPEAMHSSYLRIRKLELEISLSDVKELEGLVYLFRSCPNAESLVLWINEDMADENEYRNEEAEGAEFFWEELEDSFLLNGCLRDSMQWIEINNFNGLDCEVQLVKFLVSNTRGLRTMTINPVNIMDPNQQLAFSNLFKRLPRNCTDTKIVVNQVKAQV